MKMYTEAGNAKRVAKTIADKHPGILAAAPSVRAATAQPMFYPAVTVVAADKNAALPILKTLEDTVMVVDAVAETDTTETEPPAPAPAPTKAKGTGKTKEPKAKKPTAPKPDKKPTKTSIALGLMARKEGVTATELQTKLGWLPHTLRGFISLQNSNESRGIETKREGGVTTYIIPPKDEK